MMFKLFLMNTDFLQEMVQIMGQSITPQFVKLFHKETGYTQAKSEFLWQQFLGGINMRGKRVLDVGCGNGSHSFFLASFGGAHEVISVDPYLGEGSPADSYEVFRSRSEKLGLKNVRLVREDFRTIEELGKFDIIVSISVLHHIHETDEDTRHHTKARQEILLTFNKLLTLLNPEGWLIIVEASRYNITQFSRIFGYRGPGYLAQMDWTHKQLPAAWTSIAKEAGFTNIQFCYYVPFHLRQLSSLLKNLIFNYLTTSAYIIRAQRPEEQHIPVGR